MNHVTVGEAARQAEVNIQTLRYYERRGLLGAPARTRSNYRLYTEDAIDRVRFIKRAQRLGFTLREIEELLALRAMRARTTEVRARAEARVRQIDDHVRDLLAMREALAALVGECAGATPGADCPILRALERDDSRSHDGGLP